MLPDQFNDNVIKCRNYEEKTHIWHLELISFSTLVFFAFNIKNIYLHEKCIIITRCLLQFKRILKKNTLL